VECQECKAPLMVANSKFESSEGSTDVYSVLTMVCVNPKCSNYAGTDLNNPAKVAAVVKNKVN
jgi:hypothetical protein